MKSLIMSLIAGLVILSSSREASAFGRGRGGGGGGHPAAHAAPPAAHAAPPAARTEPHPAPAQRFDGHGVAGGAFGGVHGLDASHNFDADRAERDAHVGDFPHNGPINRNDVPNNRAGVTVVGGGARVGGGVEAGVRGGFAGRGGDLAGGAYRGGAAIAGGRGTGVIANGTRYLSASRLRDLGGAIRGNEYNYFTRDWFGSHRGAWYPGGWFGGYGPWDYPAWGALAPFLGIAAGPIPYDFGSNFVISDDSVYLNGEPSGSVADFVSQATTLADTGRSATVAPTDQWQPLGVFGLVRGNETIAERIFELAVNKAGVVRGNYYDALADSTQPIYGQVDPKTQRAAWSVGERKDIIYEAGLENLLQSEATCLIHYGTGRTVEMVLIRLPAPPSAQQTTGSGAPPLPPPQPPR